MQRPSDYILTRYLENEATPEEAEQVIDWLSTKEGEMYLNNELFNIDERTTKQSYLFGDEAFDKVKDKIAKQEAHVNWLNKSNKNKSLSIAATLLILFITLPLLHYIINEKNSVVEKPLPTKVEIRKNPKGQKSSLSLPDGTVIKLNAESRVEFEEGLPGKIRSVKLYGEAFFDVAKDTTRPFIVLVRDSLKVEALGTSFNIKAFGGEDKIEVALATGKVLVNNTYEGLKGGKKRLFLLPGQAYSFNRITGRAVEKPFDVRLSLGWVDGLLLFRNSSFDEIKKSLERWYGVEFKVGVNKAMVPRFTGEFTNESLKNVLDNVSIACKFKYSINGKNVTIY